MKTFVCCWGKKKHRAANWCFFAFTPMTDAQQRYAAYLQTDYWKEVTRRVKERAGFKCQVCNSPHDLAAHHRTYDHRGNELQHLDDLVCLCRRCHKTFHGHEEPRAIVQVRTVPAEPRRRFNTNAQRAGRAGVLYHACLRRKLHAMPSRKKVIRHFMSVLDRGFDYEQLKAIANRSTAWQEIPFADQAFTAR